MILQTAFSHAFRRAICPPRVATFRTQSANRKSRGSGEILDAPNGGIGSRNPLRYRGYYYDTETGFYYLQSRYYDPIVKRFLNADSYASTGQGFLGYNMFAYCGNKPVMCEDPSGNRMNTCQMLTDSGAHVGNPIPVKKTKTNSFKELKKLYSLGFSEPQGAVNATANITKTKRAVSKGELFLDNADKQLQKAFFTFGLGMIYNSIGLILAVNDCCPNESVNVLPGEYPCYVVNLEYDLEDPVTHDYLHYYETRTYIVVSNSLQKLELYPVR